MLTYKREIGTAHQIFVIVKNAYFTRQMRDVISWSRLTHVLKTLG